MIAEHMAAGTKIEALTRSRISAREPRLASLPPLAAWVPDDFAIEAPILAKHLVDAARPSGAEFRQGSVEAVETSGGRVKGVRMGEERLSANIVVLANGYDAGALGSSAGADLPLYESPAVLTRFGGEPCPVRHLIRTAELEFRPTMGGGLTAVADCPDDGEAGLSRLVDNTATKIAALFGMAAVPPLLSVTTAQRPMTMGGMPISGFVGGLDGLYALVAHPGIILAPFLGRLCAEAIMHS